jgi:hypothetical protein
LGMRAGLVGMDSSVQNDDHFYFRRIGSKSFR